MSLVLAGSWLVVLGAHVDTALALGTVRELTFYLSRVGSVRAQDDVGKRWGTAFASH